MLFLSGRGKAKEATQDDEDDVDSAAEEAQEDSEEGTIWQYTIHACIAHKVSHVYAKRCGSVVHALF